MLQGPEPVSVPVSSGEPLAQKGPLPASVAVGSGMAVTVPVFAVPVHPLPAVAVRSYVRVEL